MEAGDQTVEVYLELDVSLAADGNVAANVGVVAVLLQELNVTNENLAQPLQDLRVVEYLVLDQLLGDRKQHLRTGHSKQLLRDRE